MVRHSIERHEATHAVLGLGKSPGLIQKNHHIGQGMADSAGILHHFLQGEAASITSKRFFVLPPSLMKHGEVVQRNGFTHRVIQRSPDVQALLKFSPCFVILLQRKEQGSKIVSPHGSAPTVSQSTLDTQTVTRVLEGELRGSEGLTEHGQVVQNPCFLRRASGGAHYLERTLQDANGIIASTTPM